MQSKMQSSAIRCGIATTILCVVLAVAGCGDDNGGDGGGDTSGQKSDAEARAEAIVEKSKAVPQFTLDAPPIDASEAEGKKILAIPGASANPFATGIVAEMKKIADQLGIELTEYENPGTPNSWAQGVEQAISQQADLIVLAGGSDPSLVMPQLKRAYAQGITAVTAHYYQAGQVPQEVQDLGVAHSMGPFNVAAKLLVDYAFAERGEDLHPLIITSKEAAPSNGMVESMQAELKSLCPSCEAEVLNVPIPEWATKMKSAVASQLGSNPEINFVLPLYDSMSINAAAGIRSAGKGDQAPIASFNGTPAVLKMIQDDDIVAMDLGESISWIAYATMDQGLRLLLDEEPIPDGENNTKLPLRMFDDSNAAETGEPPDANKGYGDAHVEGYEKLWGLR